MVSKLKNIKNNMEKKIRIIKVNTYFQKNLILTLYYDFGIMKNLSYDFFFGWVISVGV